MRQQLPPGPSMPAAMQTLGMWSRPTAFLERARSRYGTPFTIRMLGQSPLVIVSDPEQIKQMFTAPADVLHPGEGARILEPIVGSDSVILLDEAPHLEQRRLLLPAFHGERMDALTDVMLDVTRREVDSWPLDERVALHPRLQGLTLEIILRAVFGLERGSRLDRLRDALRQVLAFGRSPLSLLPPPPPLLARFGAPAKLTRLLATVDELVYELIDERRSAGGGGEDILALLLAAEHEDGSPMSGKELRDELITALVAGHETTASQLSWTFARLAHEPAVLSRLQAEIDTAEDEEYLTATINEIMRRRPVLPNAEPRVVKKPVDIGDRHYEPGVTLLASAYLVHHDPAIYPDPYAFRPERFLAQAPGTYTWIPFGGGRRRCIGAAFATQEMKIVIRTVLQRFMLDAGSQLPEGVRRVSITIAPTGGCSLTLRRRTPARAETRTRAPEAALL
jgi:cytochrome P450